MSNEQHLLKLRSIIRDDPGIVLDDPDLMGELAEHAEATFGEKVIDLRGAALKVLERRRATLEKTNRTITEESQRNFASVQRVHRATVTLLNCQKIEDFCAAIRGPVKEVLQIDRILVLVESPFAGLKPNKEFGPIKSYHTGFILEYYGSSTVYKSGRIRLRSCPNISSDIYHNLHHGPIQSEAVLPLSLRGKRHADQSQEAKQGKDFALMLLGSRDVNVFQPNMGTDLLAFFREVVECTLRRWTI